MNLLWQMVLLFLLESMTKLHWLHWQHKLFLLGSKNMKPDCAFMDYFSVNLHWPYSSLTRVRLLHSLQVGLTLSEQSTIAHNKETKVFLLTEPGSKTWVNETKLSKPTGKWNAQPMSPALPDGFQWKYTAFSQVILWQAIQFSQVKGKLKYRED